MKQLKDYLLEIAFNKGFITSDDIENISKTYNVSYNDVMSESLDLNIDVISKDEVLFDLSKIEKDTILKNVKSPLLTKEEELQLFKRLEHLRSEMASLNQLNPDEFKLYKQYKKEIDSIKTNIINVNTPLIKFIAKKFNVHNLQFDDLISEGKLGMAYAIDQYDYNKNTRFTTYAYYKVYQAIKRLIQNYDRTIRVPVHIVELTSKIIKTRDMLTNKLSRIPTHEEIALELNIPVKNVDICLSNSSNILSLDFKIDDDDKTALSDLLYDELALSPYESIVNELGYQELLKVLNTFSEKERDIFMMRYGLLDNKSYILEDIGSKYGISKERVRQILEQTKRKISKTAPYLKDYINGGKDGK